MSADTAGRVGSESLPESDVLEFLLSWCARDRFLAAGDPLPDGERFTLYRGVGNGADMDAVRRVSWTADAREAAWFADRIAEQYGSKDPAVFRLVVERRRVMAYTNCRCEQEFLIKLLRKDRPVRVEPMPRPREPVKYQRATVCRRSRRSFVEGRGSPTTAHDAFSGQGRPVKQGKDSGRHVGDTCSSCGVVDLQSPDVAVAVGLAKVRHGRCRAVRLPPALQSPGWRFPVEC